MNITQQKGLITEIQVQLKFVQAGINVYIPLANDSRCDLIVEINKKLFKIQIKSSRLTENKTGIVFNTCSTRMNHTEGNIKQKYNQEDVDFFATYYNNQVYLIPIELCQGTQRTLVFKNQKQNGATVYFIEDFQFEKIIKNIQEENSNNYLTKTTYVSQIDIKTNKKIGQYQSYAEASRAIGKGNAGTSHISQAARGERKTAYGYIWKLIEL